jgi:heat shock protein HslJ
MKSLKIVLSVLFSSFLLWSCTSQTTKFADSENLQREWMLVSFQDFSKDFLMKSNARINLIPNAENPHQYSAEMGCNNLFFTAKIMSGNKIEFSQVGSTMMFCEGIMDLESAFGKTLPNMNSYKIEGHYLTLLDGLGKEMRFVAADWD